MNGRSYISHSQNQIRKIYRVATFNDDERSESEIRISLRRREQKKEEKLANFKAFFSWFLGPFKPKFDYSLSLGVSCIW